MPVQLIDLPYSTDALAPAIGKDTLETHHGKHHKAYVDKTNGFIEGTDLANASLEDIIRAAESNGDKKLFNNAAQVWNHGFYWHSLSPQGGQPSGELSAAIDKSFGSLAALSEKLADAAVNHFASGWAWLAADGDTLTIEETHDAGTLATSGKNPLLTIDVWEHAYYLDRKNVRPDYVKAVIGEVFNWNFAAENFARGTAWVYG